MNNENKNMNKLVELGTFTQVIKKKDIIAGHISLDNVSVRLLLNNISSSSVFKFLVMVGPSVLTA